MAGKVGNSINNLLNEISAIQTLVKEFPISLVSFGGLNFSSSVDVLSLLLKLLGISKEEIIERWTEALLPDKDKDEGTGFIAQLENVIKLALETNLSNILNCSTNPIIDNSLLDYYYKFDTNKTIESGAGIDIKVSEIDFTGVLNKNPFTDAGSKFYFDVDYKPGDLYKSKDFNAFLWYIINKSDKSLDKELIWDNTRYKMWAEPKNKKEIIRCTYVDEEYPQSDIIKVHICGARNEKPANYFKTRPLSKKVNDENEKWYLNETIFQFNHEFLASIKLYDPKVIVAEMVDAFVGGASYNIGFSLNEKMIEAKVQNIIKKVISVNDLEVSDCYFSFSNDELNEMLENAEKSRFNIVKVNGNDIEVNVNQLLNGLSGMTNTSTLIKDKSVIEKTLYDIEATPAQDPTTERTLEITFSGWFEQLLNMIIYPLIKPLFTPKVMFLLTVNRKIMGQQGDFNFEDFMKSLFIVIKDVIVKIKDLLLDMFLSWVMEKLSELLAIFASKLLLETLNTYRTLLEQLIEDCSFGMNQLIGVIDNVNYAEIVKTEPNQEAIC